MYETRLHFNSIHCARFWFNLGSFEKFHHKGLYLCPGHFKQGFLKSYWFKNPFFGFRWESWYISNNYCRAWQYRLNDVKILEIQPLFQKNKIDENLQTLSTILKRKLRKNHLGQNPGTPKQTLRGPLSINRYPAHFSPASPSVEATPHTT